MAKTTFADMVRQLSGGQLEALGRKLWRAAEMDPDRVKALLDDELKIVLEPAQRKWFDRHGRGIPYHGMTEEVVDADRAYYLEQPKIDCADVLQRAQRAFQVDDLGVTAEELIPRYRATIQRIKDDSTIANLLKGVHVLVVMPQMSGDLGTMLDETFIPALERSYHAQYPARTFTNYLRGKLADEVTVIAGTRQERLIAAMEDGPVCVVYFPTALQGFSIPADREFITHLPEDLILSGMDVPVAVALYPEVFGRDYQTPGLDLAALQWRTPAASLYLNTCVGDACFVSSGLQANVSCTGGLSILI